MNRKQLGILLVLVLIVGTAGIIVFNQQKSARAAGNVGLGKKLLGDLPVNDLTQVTVRHGTNEVNLIRKEDSWRVAERQDYPANFSQLSEFLLKVRELKAVQSEQVGASQLGRLQLAQGHGTNAPTVVEFKVEGGRSVGSLLLGKMHMSSRRGPSPMGGDDAGWPDGRYVMAGTNSEMVAVVSETFDNIEPNAGQWLNKDFVKVVKPRLIEVNFPEATNSWKLIRETESVDWKLADSKADEQLDSAKIVGVTSPFSSPSITDVMAGNQVAQDGTNLPTVVKIETLEGFRYTLRVGEKQGENYPITVAVEALSKDRTAAEGEKAEDKSRLDKEFADQEQKQAEKLKQEQAFENWTYLISSWTVEPIMKKRSELLAEKNDEAHSGDDAVDVEPPLEGEPEPAAHDH